MFDWNENGKHDTFDDFVTFGLVHHIIEDSKKNEQPPAQNNRRGIIVTMIIPIHAVKR